MLRANMVWPMLPLHYLYSLRHMWCLIVGQSKDISPQTFRMLFDMCLNHESWLWKSRVCLRHVFIDKWYVAQCAYSDMVPFEWMCWNSIHISTSLTTKVIIDCNRTSSGWVTIVHRQKSLRKRIMSGLLKPGKILFIILRLMTFW